MTVPPAMMWKAVAEEMHVTRNGIICALRRTRTAVPQMIIGRQRTPSALKVGITTIGCRSGSPDPSGLPRLTALHNSLIVEARTAYTAITRNIRIELVPYFWNESKRVYIPAAEYWPALCKKHGVDIPEEVGDNILTD